ncbi:hypothetical protein CK203_048322 [Vitis vinifera]|uniref:Retrotransposon Copia-like N-terminal domain-containing protein n=1 Tax=Vitis vinifera TaxID=29760 RepID=A0A438HRI4_VITVI|nr:hypothetical protein CK203_048322 [Vitis vinifera]
MAHGGQHNNDNRFQPLTSLTSGSTTTQSDQSLMENTNNPFFLHSGDNPGLVLISHLLTGSNAKNTWSRAMLMVLTQRISSDSWMALFAAHNRQPYSRNLVPMQQHGHILAP